MDHISSKSLRKLRWLFIAYAAHFLVVYIYVGMRYGAWHGTKTLPIEVIILVIIQLVFELIISLFFIKRWTYIAVNLTTMFILVETSIVFNPSGVYYSPYIITYMAMAFLTGALGWAWPLGLSTSMFTFYLFGIEGFLATPVQITTKFKILGLVEIVIVALLSLAGHLFWRKYYDFSENIQLKRLNAMLKRRQQQSTIILDSIGDGVIVFDARGTIDLINPTASAMVGMETKDAFGKSIYKVVNYSSADVKSTEPLPDLFKSSLEGKKHLSQNVQLNTPNIQHDLIVSLSVSPIVISPNNELVGGVAILHDVTKEQEVEQQRSDFISTASHEMRTPIATVEAYLDLVLTDKVGKLQPETRGYLEQAHDATKHLGQLFRDLLTTSSADDGQLSNHPTIIDLNELLDKISKDSHYAHKKDAVKLEFNVIAKNQLYSHAIKPKYYIYADKDRIEELFTNLVDNAMKYTEVGKITIELSGDDDNIQVSVHDTGAGIPEEDINHLFQKFYRVDSTITRAVGGTGLGLFICRKIVELYGGHIWVESKLNAGSTFYVSIPRLSDKKIHELKDDQKPAKPAHAPEASVEQVSQTAESK